MERFYYINPNVAEGRDYDAYVVCDRTRGRHLPLARCEDGDDARRIVDALNAGVGAHDVSAQQAVEGFPA